MISWLRASGSCRSGIASVDDLVACAWKRGSDGGKQFTMLCSSSRTCFFNLCTWHMYWFSAGVCVLAAISAERTSPVKEHLSFLLAMQQPQAVQAVVLELDKNNGYALPGASASARIRSRVPYSSLKTFARVV